MPASPGPASSMSTGQAGDAAARPTPVNRITLAASGITECCCSTRRRFISILCGIYRLILGRAFIIGPRGPRSEQVDAVPGRVGDEEPADQPGEGGAVPGGEATEHGRDVRGEQPGGRRY